MPTYACVNCGAIVDRLPYRFCSRQCWQREYRKPRASSIAAKAAADAAFKAAAENAVRLVRETC